MHQTFGYNFLFYFRIRKIENLDALTKLDVLDLHGNKVCFEFPR